jgi:capsular exopolysaccharide synthesis family protein
MPPSDPNLHDNTKHPLEPRNGSAGRAARSSPQIAVIDNPGHRVLPAPPALAAPPNPMSLLLALRRRWLLALVAGLALGIVGAVAVWYIPGLGRTGGYSLVRVAATPPRLVFALGENEFDFEKYQKTQAAIVRNQAVLDAAFRDPRLAELSSLPDPAQRVAWLERNLTVDFILGPEVMRIKLLGEHPEDQVVVVDAITREFLKETARLEREDRATRLEKVTAAAARCQDDLAHHREALRKLLGAAADDNDPTGVAVKQRLAVEKLAQADRDLSQARSELTRLRAEVENRKGKDVTPQVFDYQVDEALAARLEKDTFALRLAARHAELEELIRVTLEVARDPEVQSAPLRREAESVREGLEKYRQQARTAVVRMLQDRARGSYQAETAKMIERIPVLEQEERLQAEKVKRWTEDASPLKGGVDIQPMRDAITKAEATARRVSEQADALRIEQDAQPRITLLQPAAVLPRDTQRQIQMAGLAGFGVFGCVVFGIALWEFRSRRVASLDEVSQGLGLRLLGALPHMPTRVRARLAGPNAKQDQRWHAMLTESIDVTRTLLLHDAQAGSLQVVLVTSATEGEGKTSLASQLAASLARAGRKTVLVDCDLRKPAAHRLFDLPLEPGFSEVLRGEIQLSGAIQPTRLSRLWLVPAGICDSHTTQALAQDTIPTLFQELRGQFEYVILDSAPVLPVADSLLLAEHVDGVIFSILRDESRLPRVHAAQQRLAGLGVRVLGAVINGTQGNVYGSAYQNPNPVPAAVVAAQ